MLARSVVARVAANVHKTSTHELSRPSHIIRNRLLSSNGIVVPIYAGRMRAHRTVFLPYRRSYATEARATKPTAKVTRDVKKAAARKTSGKTTPKKKTGTKDTTKKAATKRAKTAAKPKPVVKKKVTPEEKEQEIIRQLKKRALKPPSKPTYTFTAYVIWLRQNYKQDGRTFAERSKSMAEQYQAVTPAEMEHYNHLANEETSAKRAEYKAWILQYAPEQIQAANLARSALNRKLKSKQWTKLVDERIPKRPASSFIIFNKERRASGDFKNIKLAEAAKLVSEEWKSLSATERKKYEDEAEARRLEYHRELEKAFAQSEHSTA